jgi:hypothetical protein
MTHVTKAHEEKETLSIDINVPEHDARVTTSLFINSKKALIERDGGRCWICNKTAEESGHPLEAHHWVVERSLMNMIDFDLVKTDCKAGIWGRGAQEFDWNIFDPKDPTSFVDNMLANGKILCKFHHVGFDAGIHGISYPLWIAQRYGKEGYQFSNIEVIHHEQN